MAEEPKEQPKKETPKAPSPAERDAALKAAFGVGTDERIDTEHSQFVPGKFKDEAVHQKETGKT